MIPASEDHAGLEAAARPEVAVELNVEREEQHRMNGISSLVDDAEDEMVLHMRSLHALSSDLRLAPADAEQHHQDG